MISKEKFSFSLTVYYFNKMNWKGFNGEKSILPCRKMFTVFEGERDIVTFREESIYLCFCIIFVDLATNLGTSHHSSLSNSFIPINNLIQDSRVFGPFCLRGILSLLFSARKIDCKTHKFIYIFRNRKYCEKQITCRMTLLKLLLFNFIFSSGAERCFLTQKNITKFDQA